MIRLDRPLAWLDAETTGPRPHVDRIVELAVGIQQPGSADIAWKVRRVNPCLPIPAGATEVHGITDADVADCPTFASLSRSLFAALDPCDLAGFGIRRFDVPLLVAEFHRCGMAFDVRGRYLVDLLSIFHHEEPRDLAGAVRFYLGRELGRAHSAQADVGVCPEVLDAQVARYGLAEDVAGLQAYLDEHSPYEGGLEAWFAMPDPARPVDWTFRRGKHE
ncbi:MAG TPA: 3'-5' exonuclease, partial [Desulfobacterales bacterium]|nr:3'-5' exonuclease [Desulfobacterales bacterium]